MLTVGSLFSGIGGFELGLEATGEFETIWQCEINEYCLKVLAKHWPDVKRFTDIKKMGIEEVIPYADVICGGFPCQPVSCAGKRKGREDERWLWPEFYRVICSVKPRWVLVENVPGLFSAKDTEGNKGALFGGILRDLAAAGYNAKWQIISAASVGAPHLRKRVIITAWKIANSKSGGCGFRAPADKRAAGGESDAFSNRSEVLENTQQQSDRCEVFSSEIDGQNSERSTSGPSGSGSGGRKRIISDTNSSKLWEQPRRGSGQSGQGSPELGADGQEGSWWAIEPDVGRVAHGISARVDRLRALGNAIVPQCAEVIGRQLLDMEASL